MASETQAANPIACDVAASHLNSLDALPHSAGAAIPATMAKASAVVLTFPIRGEALLANLASVLRCRVGSMSGNASFLLTMARNPWPRLAIDHDASVEFHTDTASFHLRIDAEPTSRLTLETTDFAMLVKFILEYLADRYGEEQQSDVAP